MIRIAVDAMGGDYAPREVVHGAVLAAREYGVAIHLVGPVDQVNAELKRHDVKGLTIEIAPCSEVVEMGEKATKAILKKKDSSIVVTTKLVADGVADGMVAAGSTGAAGVAAQLGLGRIKNVERAAIAAMLPTTTKGKQVIIVDVGANIDSNPNQLLQFGLMGSILAKGMQGCVNPTIGLLNIGTEETKGNKLVQETFQLLKAHKEINFIGFVEGRDFPMNKVDVVVTDGFTGNIALKTAEGIARMIQTILKQEVMSSPRTQLGGILVKPSFDGLRRRIDYNELGGALLVGVKGVCVIAHGSSKHTAIKNAIRVAKTMAAAKIVQQIEDVLSLGPSDAVGSKT